MINLEGSPSVGGLGSGYRRTKKVLRGREDMADAPKPKLGKKLVAAKKLEKKQTLTVTW